MVYPGIAGLSSPVTAVSSADAMEAVVSEGDVLVSDADVSEDAVVCAAETDVSGDCTAEVSVPVTCVPAGAGVFPQAVSMNEMHTAAMISCFT